MKLFKRRLKQIQEGYDLGWKHGYEAGMDERHKQIIDAVNKFVHDVNWLKEEPYTRKDIVEAIKNHDADKDPIGWEK